MPRQQPRAERPKDSALVVHCRRRRTHAITDVKGCHMHRHLPHAGQDGRACDMNSRNCTICACVISGFTAAARTPRLVAR